MIDLITDRTALDEIRADFLQNKIWKDMTQAEKTDWLSSLKGRYNFTDMNRVGTAVGQLRDLLDQCGYHAPVAAKQDWTMSELATASDLQTYIDDIATLRASLSAFSDTPTAPSAYYQMTYQKANDIEKILLDIEVLISNMIDGYYYLNEIYCGEI